MRVTAVPLPAGRLTFFVTVETQFTRLATDFAHAVRALKYFAQGPKRTSGASNESKDFRFFGS